MRPKRISTSQQMFARFERRKNWRRSVAVCYLVVYFFYLLWRATIINEDSLALSLAYLFAESLGFILGISIVIRSWSYRHRDVKPCLIGRTVDIFIPVYKEPLHLIRRTLIAAKEIEYPHQTYVLDDGKRAEIMELAAELGIRYLCRPQNTNAKAGNLNFGLQNSSGEFVMVFDADHIAMPHALKITLGFFADEKIAMVQTPQDYYNTTAFQYMNCKRSGALWTDQAFFYNIAQPCYDSVDNASCVGTGVIYRRKSLEEIGGIPVTTVTEDTHTSLKLNKLGLKTIYINDAVAYGIASSDLSEYCKTRQRWGHGNIHAIKEEKILSSKSLSLRQRALHMTPMFHCLEGWQQLFLLFIPVVTLIFGLAPFEISVFNVIITFFFPFVSYAMLQEIGCGFSRLWTNEIFSMIRWPIHLKVSLAWFGAKLKWSSSIKNIKGKVNWKLMLPQIFVLIASVAALIVAFFKLQKAGFKVGPIFLYIEAKILGLLGAHDLPSESIDIHAVMKSGYTADLVLIAGMWVVYNIFRAAFFIGKAVNDSANSHEFFRFEIPFALTLSQNNFSKVLQISEEWISYFDHTASTKAGEHKKILLHLPAHTMVLSIMVKKISGKKVEAEIIWDSSKDRDDLARALYSVDWHREFRNRNAYFFTPSDFILRLLSFKTPYEKKYKEWKSLYYQGRFGVIADFAKQERTASLIVFEELQKGENISATRIGNDDAQNVNLEILEEETLSSLVEKGLDGAMPRRYKVAVLA